MKCLSNHEKKDLNPSSNWPSLISFENWVCTPHAALSHTALSHTALSHPRTSPTQLCPTELCPIQLCPTQLCPTQLCPYTQLCPTELSKRNFLYIASATLTGGSLKLSGGYPSFQGYIAHVNLQDPLLQIKDIIGLHNDTSSECIRGIIFHTLGPN